MIPLFSNLSTLLHSLRASPVGKKGERDGSDKKVASLPLTRSYAQKQNTMKFSIIAIHLYGLLQFVKTPHFVQSTKKVNEDTVTVNSSPNAASVTYTASGEGEKRKFSINVNVPVGSAVFQPALTSFGSNEDRDRVLNAVKNALDSAGTEEIGGATVIAPKDEA